ncbi:LON peptidase substrate-binding domain-containing protein [Pelagibacteraceae bacterium]|nr:LON peptidase substrate-binding domain-containing protein [Pelagibacteraceae bacterium]
MKSFPDIIPIFPLSGVIYFPKTNLPLNIFEKRYLDLVNDAYNKDRFMGMIQSKKENQNIYKIGCLGKINDYERSEDGRVLINLTGVTRFEIIDEINNDKLYREFKVNYNKFGEDLLEKIYKIKINDMMDKAKLFFKRSGLLLNWKEFEKLEFVQKINTLAMIAPITNQEKQKLLETITTEDKIKILENIIDFYLHQLNYNNQTIQ